MKPNILFIIIDSLRADRCYNDNKTAKTPNIDKLIQKGIYFSQAISTSDSTAISLGSIFTGKYPFKTGITHFTYNSDILTYFDILKKNDYNVYGIFPDTSFFLKLSSRFDEQSPYIYDKRESWLQLVGGIGKQILEKLESKRMIEPWIYFIHLMDLHSPFFIPKKFDHEEHGQTRYDRMVFSIDFWIGRILQKIDQQKTLLILSSDHGDYIPVSDEAVSYNTKSRKILRKFKNTFPALVPIGEKFILQYHSLKRTIKKKKLGKKLSSEEMRTFNLRADESLYDESIRIPLIFYGYGISKQKLITSLVRQVDIFPTIFEICNFSNKIKKIHGRSLYPLFKDKLLNELPAYIETGSRDPKKIGKIIGLRTKRYKYLRSREDVQKNVCLFDLESDPLEQNNLTNLQPHLVQQMEKKLSEIRKDSKDEKPKSLSEEETKKIEEELRKLGYL
ncbi:MAG: sulfatase-like hydrolase/transferase [Thaumarchaeota archaeon]|nr:sulfatase-like hydrolase/transferase [Nitrososphaerota archaeon]